MSAGLPDSPAAASDVAARSARIAALDGVPLAATHYAAAGARAARVVVVASATGVRRGFYDAFARALAARGLVCVTFDYRGIGDSRPASLRGFAARLRDWGERDVAAVLAWAEREHGAAPAYVGHSVGGQLLGLSPAGARVSAAVLVAAQSGWYGHWPVPRRWLWMGLWHLLVPAACAVAGYFPARRLGFGAEDLPGGVAREWARWCRTPHYFSDEDGRPIAGHFADVTAPILAWSVEGDAYAPRAAVEALLARYRQASRTHRHLGGAAAAGLGHFGFFRAGRAPALWDEAAAWLGAGAPASAPSAAAAG